MQHCAFCIANAHTFTVATVRLARSIATCDLTNCNQVWTNCNRGTRLVATTTTYYLHLDGTTCNWYDPFATGHEPIASGPDPVAVANWAWTYCNCTWSSCNYATSPVAMRVRCTIDIHYCIYRWKNTLIDTNIRIHIVIHIEMISNEYLCNYEYKQR